MYYSFFDIRKLYIKYFLLVNFLGSIESVNLVCSLNEDSDYDMDILFVENNKLLFLFLLEFLRCLRIGGILKCCLKLDYFLEECYWCDIVRIFLRLLV